MQLSPIPSDDCLAERYQEGYGASSVAQSNESILQFARSNRAGIILKTMEQLKIPKESFILDIGCSFGYDLYALRNLGGFKNVFGVELSQTAARVANQILNIPVVTQLNLLISQGLRFDFVYLKHNLEHQPHPLSLLRDLKQLMNSDAHLFIGVPNRKSINGLWGKRWEWVTPPIHIHYFDRKSLQNLVDLAEYQVLRYYSQRGDGLPFFKHALFFSPLIGRMAARWIGGPYANATHPLRKCFDLLFSFLAIVTRPLSQPLKSAFLVGEELWVLCKKIS